MKKSFQKQLAKSYITPKEAIISKIRFIAAIVLICVYVIIALLLAYDIFFKQ